MAAGAAVLRDVRPRFDVPTSSHTSTVGGVVKRRVPLCAAFVNRRDSAHPIDANFPRVSAQVSRCAWPAMKRPIRIRLARLVAP